MKNLFAIAAITATVALTGCQKEIEGGNPVKEGEQAKLTVNVVGANTRSIGQVTDNSDNEIGQFKVFAFEGETLKAVLTSVDGSVASQSANITTSIDAVYVIANANAYFPATIVIPGTTTKTAFLEMRGALCYGSWDIRVLTNGKVWASSAVKTLTPADFVGTNKEASITIPVVPVTARINVEVNDERINLDKPGAWIITNTCLYNVPAATRFIAPAGYVSPVEWITGAAIASNPTALYRSYLEDIYDPTGHMFYVLDNDGSEFPTILSLFASNDARVTQRYFPIHFTLEDAGHTIERGNSYQVKFTLTGDALDDPGIITPEDPVLTSKLTVAITATPWVMIPIDKTF